jgi:hypothetical protein
MCEKLCHISHQPGHQARQCPLNCKNNKGRKVVAVGGNAPSKDEFVRGGFLSSLGAAGQVSREDLEAVLDLTKHDFQDILHVTGRLFEIGVHRSDGCLSTVVCPNSEFLKQDLKEKNSWLNHASSANELSERACATNPLSTSVCVLTRQSMSLDMSLLKNFGCVLTVPKGGIVRQQQENGFWSVAQSPKRL